MRRFAMFKRAVLMAFYGLLVATPLWAEPQNDPSQDEQLRVDRPQIARPRPDLNTDREKETSLQCVTEG
jgi:hypothetical protein